MLQIYLDRQLQYSLFQGGQAHNVMFRSSQFLVDGFRLLPSRFEYEGRSMIGPGQSLLKVLQGNKKGRVLATYHSIAYPLTTQK